MSATANKGYETQTTGSNAGTWGEVLNNQMITYVDNNLGGITTMSLSSSTPVALTTAEARNGLLIFTGALLANIAVTTTALGVFWVENRTTGAFYVSLSNGVGNPVLIPQGAARQVWSDATYGIRAMGLEPPGSIVDIGASTAHATLLATSSLNGEYLLCDGSAVSRTIFANLFASIGTTWGIGNGSSTFNVPDFRGRGRFGKDNMGGSSASRITTAGSGIDGATVGSVGGAQNITLSASNLPANIPNSASTGLTSASLLMSSTGLVAVGSGSSAIAGASGGTSIVALSAYTTVTINPSGGSPTVIMPPTGIVNVLIKV